MTTTEHAMGLTWESRRSPATEAELQAVEGRFGVRLPDDARDLLRRCQGGRPLERRYFRYHDPRRGDAVGVLGALLTLGPDDDESILGTVDALAHDDQLPAGVIPFAEDGGGDLMCLDVRSSPAHPPVVYWNHERRKEESLVPLADSLAAFIDRLEESYE